MDSPGRSKQAEKGELNGLNGLNQQEPVEIHQERNVNQLNTRIFKTPKKIGT